MASPDGVTGLLVEPRLFLWDGMFLLILSVLTVGCNLWQYVSKCSAGRWSAVRPEHFWAVSVYKTFEYSNKENKKFWKCQLLLLQVDFPSWSTVVLHQLSLRSGQNRPNCRPQGIMNFHSNIKVCPICHTCT
jgi:hypothetical protein